MFLLGSVTVTFRKKMVAVLPRGIGAPSGGSRVCTCLLNGTVCFGSSEVRCLLVVLRVRLSMKGSTTSISTSTGDSPSLNSVNEAVVGSVSMGTSKGAAGSKGRRSASCCRPGAGAVPWDVRLHGFLSARMESSK